MAPALRIQRPGGRYHVTARGNEGRAIYREESGRAHFLELLGELTEREGKGGKARRKARGEGKGVASQHLTSAA